MFLGIFDFHLDKRDRISIPAKMRDKLYHQKSGHPVLTCGFEKCLYIFPYERWERFAESVESLMTNREEARRLERYLFANAMECPMDRQGRILISPQLKKYAGLKNDLVIVGVRHRIEIWDKMTWERESKEIKSKLKEISEKNEGFMI